MNTTLLQVALFTHFGEGIVKDGRLVEGWGQHDRLGQLQQMGVIPETEELRIRLREKLEISAGNEPDVAD